MSRTIRRKNGWEKPTYSIEVNASGVWDKKYYDKSSLEYKKALNEYHRDNSTYSGVPHEYVNLNCERPLRRKSKKILKDWIKNPDFEPMVPLFRKGAGYDYW